MIRALFLDKRSLVRLLLSYTAMYVLYVLLFLAFGWITAIALEGDMA